MTAFPPMMVKYIENNLDIVKPVDSERTLPVPCSIWEVLNSHCQSRTQTLLCIVLLICSLISTEFKWKLFRWQRNRKYYIQTVVMRAPLKAALASWAPSINNAPTPHKPTHSSHPRTPWELQMPFVVTKWLPPKLFVCHLITSILNLCLNHTPNPSHLHHITNFRLCTFL